MKTLLVQACCGPCACDPSIFSDYSKVFYFNGDNFDSKCEYDRRFFAMRTVSSGTIAELYEPKEFACCEDCIRYRLRACADTAKKYGFDCFSTTLTVSPHKNTNLVNKIGREVSAEASITFVEADLKKNGGFQRSVEISKQLGLYRQKYCGCARSGANIRHDAAKK